MAKSSSQWTGFKLYTPRRHLFPYARTNILYGVHLHLESVYFNKFRVLPERHMGKRNVKFWPRQIHVIGRDSYEYPCEHHPVDTLVNHYTALSNQHRRDPEKRSSPNPLKAYLAFCCMYLNYFTFSNTFEFLSMAMWEYSSKRFHVRAWTVSARTVSQFDNKLLVYPHACSPETSQSRHPKTWRKPLPRTASTSLKSKLRGN